MGEVRLSTRVQAPVEEVFATYSDFPHAAERIEEINRVEMLTDGPVHLGTRFRETRTMFGKQASEEMEITRFEPHHLYKVTARSCGCLFETTFQFTDDEGTTRVDMNMVTEPQTLTAKLLSPLGWLMSGTMKKCLQSDMEQLKQHCEHP